MPKVEILMLFIMLFIIGLVPGTIAIIKNKKKIGLILYLIDIIFLSLIINYFLIK